MNFHLCAHDCIYKRQKPWVMNKDRLVHDHFYLMTSSNWSMWHQIDQCDIITVSVSTKMCSIVLGIVSDLKSWYLPFPEKLGGAVWHPLLFGAVWHMLCLSWCFASFVEFSLQIYTYIYYGGHWYKPSVNILHLILSNYKYPL